MSQAYFPTEKLFIISDYKSKMGRNIIPGVMQKYDENVTNNNGKMFLSRCTQNELCINKIFPTKNTFANIRNQKYAIDYIITNIEVSLNQILNVRVLSLTNIGTQKGLVLCKYCLYVKPPRHYCILYFQIQYRIVS